MRACRSLRAADLVGTLQDILRKVSSHGGGAQVGQVAIRHLEADRHNIRGERISVDTIPLWGDSRWPMPFGRVPPAAGARAGAGPARSWAVRSSSRARRARPGPARGEPEHGGQRARRRRSVVTDPVQAGVMT